jgi:hypothetical protein
VLDENFSKLAFGPQSAENVAARAMEISRDASKGAAMRALARTGCAKHQNCPVFHVENGVVKKSDFPAASLRFAP